MDYREAWSFLDQLQFFKIKLGLDSMQEFLDRAGRPQDTLRFVHVAGTNGKGSVAVILQTILAAAGYRVGLYTSPHLSSVRERFRINNAFISQADFAEMASRIRDVLNGRQITYFEFTTALALLWFAREDVDVVILEVGMGGRLDATNVVRPLVSVITNVSMDHEAYLGHTLAEVAREKAGIIKPGVPVVSAVGNDQSRLVVQETCREQNAPLYLLGRDFEAHSQDNGTWRYAGIHDHWSFDQLRCALQGEHQVANAALAVAALELLAGLGFKSSALHIRTGLSSVRWPGRMEHFCVARNQAAPDETAAFEVLEPCPADSGRMGAGRRFLLDGAHNPAGIQRLCQSLAKDYCYRHLILVWACMADKDMAATLLAIAPLASQLILTRPEGERSATAEQLITLLPVAEREKARTAATVSKALATAFDLAAADDLICVAGSLYLVGAARKILLGELVS